MSTARRAAATVIALAMLVSILPSGVAAAGSAISVEWPGLLAVRLAPSGTAALDLPLVRSVTEVFPGATSDLSRWRFVEVPAGAERTVADLLEAHVDLVERVPVRVPASVNDPRFPEQWHVSRVRAPEAWRVTRGSSDVRVAVIDTQFEVEHPDLALADLAGTPRSVERYTTGCVASAPFSDHGTIVAGVVAATTDNATGVAGVGFSTRVVAAQVGTVLNGTCVVGPEWVTALHDAVEAGVPVVNLSFSGPGANALEADAVRHAAARGTLVVAAAGNAASTTPNYPAAYPHVVGVASLTRDDRLKPSSNRGLWVDLAAPGENVLTTCVPRTYCLASGTSVASPIVAGGAALTLARWGGSRSGLALRHRLTDAAATVTGRTLDPAIGHGRLDLARAVRERVVRVWGPDRVATAAAVAQHAHPAPTSTVVLVPADGDGSWRSTLPAAGLLGVHDTTFVMTRRGRLDAAAEAELLRLFDVGSGARDADRTIIIPGGTDVSVSAAVEARLAQRFTVTRIAGGDAAETAARLADAIVSRSDATTALVARGDDPADALALAGPAARHGLPILFVGRDRVPPATCDWIGAHAGVRRLVIAGGTAAVTEGVEEALRSCRGFLAEQIGAVEIVRDAGATRVGTSVAIAQRWFPRARGFVVANGWRWPDAVAGGGLSLRGEAPILLTRAEGLDPLVARYLGSRVSRGTALWVLGGTAVVAPAVERGLEQLAR